MYWYCGNCCGTVTIDSPIIPLRFFPDDDTWIRYTAGGCRSDDGTRVRGGKKLKVLKFCVLTVQYSSSYKGLLENVYTVG